MTDDEKISRDLLRKRCKGQIPTQQMLVFCYEVIALLDENEQLDVYNKTLEADLKQTEIYLYDAREQLEKAKQEVQLWMKAVSDCNAAHYRDKDILKSRVKELEVKTITKTDGEYCAVCGTYVGELHDEKEYD